ncbi:hypothetical protein ANN_15387 [Periplaneta americana]|uniref:Uncharacterized protein n=1 Tax=Periplaneta americana TaxID=6978 RepID=A0ABQ8SH75_PERAM|nr:hypothetical protein ANN_15387 [Periplaneta americana]
METLRDVGYRQKSCTLNGLRDSFTTNCTVSMTASILPAVLFLISLQRDVIDATGPVRFGIRWIKRLKKSVALELKNSIRQDKFIKNFRYQSSSLYDYWIENRKEYVDIVYVYGLCDGSSLLAVAEHERRFPNRRVPYRRLFTVYGVG